VGWTFFFMFVVLKIPIAFALWLIWWAVRQDPADRGEPRDEGGSDRHEDPHRRRPRGPRGPRRGGPHGAPLPRAPRRVRATAGRRGGAQRRVY
jgi:hypothetical protein